MSKSKSKIPGFVYWKIFSLKVLTVAIATLNTSVSNTFGCSTLLYVAAINFFLSPLRVFRWIHFFLAGFNSVSPSYRLIVLFFFPRVRVSNVALHDKSIVLNYSRSLVCWNQLHFSQITCCFIKYSLSKFLQNRPKVLDQILYQFSPTQIIIYFYRSTFSLP